MRIDISLCLCIAWAVFMLFIIQAVGEKYPKMPPIPTCADVKAGAPEYRELQKLCMRSMT